MPIARDWVEVVTPARGPAPGPARGAAGCRSHLPDGRYVVLSRRLGERRWVVDAELDRRPPSALAKRFGREQFWERWTRAECAAKLAHQPIVIWLSRYGLDEPDPQLLEIVTGRVGADIVVSCATLMPQTS